MWDHPIIPGLPSCQILAMPLSWSNYSVTQTHTRALIHTLISPATHPSVHPFIPGSTGTHSVAETVCVKLEVKPHPLWLNLWTCWVSGWLCKQTELNHYSLAPLWRHNTHTPTNMNIGTHKLGYRGMKSYTFISKPCVYNVELISKHMFVLLHIPAEGKILL